jgi:hypothetical protein
MYNRTFSVTFWLCLLTAGPLLHGQMPGSGAIDTSSRPSVGGLVPDRGPASGWTTAPVFSEDEEEDIGVQYLLLERPRHRWLDVGLENTLSLVNNPVLLERRESSADQNIFTTSLAVAFKPRKVAGGTLRLRTGLRWQWFHYGTFTGKDVLVGGLPARSNNFESRSPFVEVGWDRGAWFAFAGLRFNSLVQPDFLGKKREFYHDYHPLWVISRRVGLGDKTELWLQYTGDLRISNTESGGLLPSGWNDRTNHGVGLSLNHTLGKQWLAQASYTYQAAHYLHADRSRTDAYHNFGGALLWGATPHLRFRLFIQYDVRTSTDPATSDYRKLEGGVGAQFSLSF